MFVEEVVVVFDMLLLQWYIKLIIKVQQGLYEYDVVLWLCDLQFGDVCVKDIVNYIVKGVLWQVFDVECLSVLLIDEIDKVDIEFLNDLLCEFDWMEFYVYEMCEMVCVKYCLFVIIMLNNEKELFDVFLCCCFFYYIQFLDLLMMQKIVVVYFFDICEELLCVVFESFFELCGVLGLKKKLLMFELFDWLKLLFVENILVDVLCGVDVKQIVLLFVGVLLKNEQDLSLFEWFVYMNWYNW